MKRRELSTTYCPVGRASAEIVDGWTFVILRELAFGNDRFNGLLAQTRMSPRSLSLRLQALEKSGILRRSPDPSGARAGIYATTEKGLALWPVLVHLNDWGSRFCGPWEDNTPPVRNLHRDSGAPVSVRVVREDTGAEVTPAELRTEMAPRYRDERAANREG